MLTIDRLHVSGEVSATSSNVAKVTVEMDDQDAETGTAIQMESMNDNIVGEQTIHERRLQDAE